MLNDAYVQGILEKVPSMRLAFVGDGPARAELQEHFQGTKTTFLGMLHVCAFPPSMHSVVCLNMLHT